MPEGDTLYRIAEQLRPVLEGQVLSGMVGRPETEHLPETTGLQVQKVSAKGKHLFIELAGELVIHSHLGMTGSWHVYPKDEPWSKPARWAALVLETESHQVVCFSPKQLRLCTLADLRRDQYLSRLGPDLMAVEIEPCEIVSRFRVHNQTAIGEAVMNQTIASGIGNVYKSETLFLGRINPWTAVGKITDQRLSEYLVLAHRLMRRNRRGGKRTTRNWGDGDRLWVYRRAGKSCLKCGAKVEMSRQGDLARSTYWCPGCQPEQAEDTSGG